MHVEELRNFTLSLAVSLHHGDRLLLSSQRELRSRSTLAAGGPGTRQPELRALTQHRALKLRELPSICIIILPAALVVSIDSVKLLKSAPTCSSLVRMFRRSLRLRLSRSSGNVEADLGELASSRPFKTQRQRSTVPF
jgi:hypothetical protein